MRNKPTDAALVFGTSCIIYKGSMIYTEVFSHNGKSWNVVKACTITNQGLFYVIHDGSSIEYAKRKIRAYIKRNNININMGWIIREYLRCWLASHGYHIGQAHVMPLSTMSGHDKMSWQNGSIVHGEWLSRCNILHIACCSWCNYIAETRQNIPPDIFSCYADVCINLGV